MASTESSKNILPLPPEVRPECWSNDERMNALFAEFRNRTANSQDWDSKYKFWEKLISDWLSHSKHCSFSVSDLNVAFKRNGRSPLCLKTVVEELLKNGEIISETEFLKECSTGWTAWAIDIMVKRPVVWSFSKLKNYVVKDSIDADVKFVHMKTLKELANLILSTIDEDCDNMLMPLSRVTEKCIKKSGNVCITKQNVKLALLWLKKMNKATFSANFLENKTDVLVKISVGGVKEISEAEEGLFRLMEQEKLIIKNIEKLEMEKNEVLAKAKSSLANGMRELAKTCVRKKREIENSIEKRAATLHNVQTLIARIHDAHSNTEILAAYKTGSEILKNYENTGLTEENVTNTMDDIAEAVGEFADLQSIMSTSIVTSDTDLELEEELQELLDSSPKKTDKGDKGKPNLSDTAILPDLDKELADLKLDDFPSPPQSNIKLDSVNSF